MHELSVTQSLVDTVVKAGEDAGALKVIKVELVIGKLNTYVPEIVKDYYQLLSEDTIAEGSELNVTRIPGRVKCRNCGKESELEDFRVFCPVCKGRDVELIKGREFYIKSLEIEEK